LWERGGCWGGRFEGWSWEFGVGVSGGELDEKFNAPRTTVFGAGKSSSQVASLCWTLPSL